MVCHSTEAHSVFEWSEIMRKRAHGEGTITKRSDGRWMGRITLPKYGSKKPLRKTVYGCTQKECRDKLESLKKQAGKRLDYHQRSESLDAYLTHWLKTIKTIVEYELLIRTTDLPTDMSGRTSAQSNLKISMQKTWNDGRPNL